MVNYICQIFRFQQKPATGVKKGYGVDWDDLDDWDDYHIKDDLGDWNN